MSVYHALHLRGARFVLCGSKPAQPPSKRYPDGQPETPEDQRGKIPLSPDWLDGPRPTPAAVLKHLATGGYRNDNRVGLVPASLKLTAVDIDHPEVCDRDTLADALGGPPLAWIPSRRGGGGGHAYYPAPRLDDGRRALAGNWKWGPEAGELRGNNGHVVLWGLEETAQTLLDAIDSEARLSAVRLDFTKLPGINPRYHLLQPENPNAPAGPSSTTKARSGSRTSKAAEDEPLPLDDDAIEETLRNWPRLKTAFEEDTHAHPNKTDPSPSGWSITIANICAGYAARGTPGFSDELIGRLIATYRTRFARGRQGAQPKPGSWYAERIRRAHEWVADQREKEVAKLNPAPTGAIPQPAVVETAELDEAEIAAAVAKHEKTSKAFNGQDQALRDKSWDGRSAHLAKRALEDGIEPNTAAAIVQAQRTTTLGAPKLDETEAASIVTEALRHMAPRIPNIAEHDGTLAEFFGIEGFEIHKVRSDRNTAAATYRFVNNGLSINIGGVKALLRQGPFQEAVAQAYAKYVPPFPKGDWPTISEQLLDSAILIVPGDDRYPADLDELQQVRNWLNEYLSAYSTSTVDIGEGADDPEDRKWAILGIISSMDCHGVGEMQRAGFKQQKQTREVRRPFNLDGVPFLFIDHMAEWLMGFRNEGSMTGRKLGPLLRQVGWTSTSKRFEQDGNRRRLSVWYPQKWPADVSGL